MALSDGSTLPSTRIEAGYDERVVEDELQPHGSQQQQQQQQQQQVRD
jgi:hypothetical protein